MKNTSNKLTAGESYIAKSRLKTACSRWFGAISSPMKTGIVAVKNEKIGKIYKTVSTIKECKIVSRCSKQPLTSENELLKSDKR
ncbi:MAG: hypothetical protein IKH86_00935 [Prevotella sp.]|nr:hypothetical protein [Prevotella sp.]